MEQELIISAALLFGFLVQTIVGFGGGLVSLPIMLFVLPIAEAVAIISIFNLAFSLIQTPRNYKELDKTVFNDLFIPTVIGCIFGALILSYGSPVILKKILGIFIFVYIAYRYTKKKKISMTKIKATSLGLLGGFFAGLFASGAPPFVIYTISRFDNQNIIRANLIGILLITNVTRVAILISTGVLSLSIIDYVLWGIPAFVIALVLGEKTFRSLNKELFMKIVILFLAASALMLLFK